MKRSVKSFILVGFLTVMMIPLLSACGHKEAPAKHDQTSQVAKNATSNKPIVKVSREKGMVVKQVTIPQHTVEKGSKNVKNHHANSNTHKESVTKSASSTKK